jgi:hypothetical protein
MRVLGHLIIGGVLAFLAGANVAEMVLFDASVAQGGLTGFVIAVALYNTVVAALFYAKSWVTVS